MLERYAIFGAGQSAQAARRLARHHDLEVVLIDEAGQGDRAVFEAHDLADFDAFVLIHLDFFLLIWICVASC